MTAGRWPLADVLQRLKRVHGAPEPPPTRDPFELILWENCAYLANDARRSEAFARLKAKTGLDPKRILAAREGALEKCVAAPGRFAALQAEKLAQCAELALENHGGDLAAVLKLPRPAAALASAHLLLRAHGKVLCTRSAPHCPECPLRERCPAGAQAGPYAP